MHWLGAIGSRRRTDREAIKARIREVLAELQAEHGEVGIVSGGANPLDSRWPER